MTDFKLSCARLIEQYPLFNYCTTASSGRKRLSVLLVGYGSRMDTILREIMTQGQLLDTDLDITVANTNSKGTWESLLKRAPALPQFARVVIDQSIVSDPEEVNQLCCLRFDSVQLVPEAMSRLMDICSECTYIVISTGNDQQNRELANACAQYFPTQKTLITYVQKKATDSVEAFSSLSEVHILAPGKEDLYRKQIETIALNMHWVYSKSQDERASTQEIIRQFREDPYVFTSNIEAALHIRSKLAGCGIFDEDLGVAAANFAALIKSQPETIEVLAEMEHRRWLVSKILDGFTELTDISLIYQNGATTHSSKDKWHCCMVSCDPSGKSVLCEKDWAQEGIFRKELDALDRMTLRLHRQCGKIVTATKDQVLSLLQTIRTGCSEISCTAALQGINEVFSSVQQMYQGKSCAASRYQKAVSGLKNNLEKQDHAFKPILLNQISTLEQALLPLIEFVSRKDYKQQDRILISHIPCILTKKLCPSLVKVLSNKPVDNLLSIWNLEPERVEFFATATSASEIAQINRTIETTTRFVLENIGATELSYVVCVPEDCLANPSFEIKSSQPVYIIGVPQWNVNGLREKLLPIMERQSPDYLDVTSGDVVLVRALDLCAAEYEIPSFYTKDGRMLQLVGAEELEYEAPEKNLSVCEMFNLSGALVEETDSDNADLADCYQNLWEVRTKFYYDWSRFCEVLSKAYADTAKSIGSYSFRTEDRYAQKTRFTLYEIPSYVLEKLLPVLRIIEQQGYITIHETEREIGDTFRLILSVPKIGTDGFGYYLCDVVKNCRSEFSFHYNEYKNMIVCEELLVEQMPTTESQPDKQERKFYLILHELCKLGLLKSYVVNEEKTHCSFRIASAKLLPILLVAGSALEHQVYYSALFDAHFSDVVMGLQFLHSNSENSARNEIDIIATQGMKSIFISCKLRGRDKLKEELNYILYEITLLADRFGVNPKVVLAAPALNQFEINSKGVRVLSDDAKKALSRGVYLLGRECFAPGKLGKVLDNIMDGKEDWYNV